MIPPQLLLARSSPGWLLLILQLQWLLQALGRRLGAPGRACLPAPTLLLRLPLGTRADARSWRHAGGYQHCRGSQKQQSGSQRCLGPAARHMGRRAAAGLPCSGCLGCLGCHLHAQRLAAVTNTRGLRHGVPRICRLRCRSLAVRCAQAGAAAAARVAQAGWKLGCTPLQPLSTGRRTNLHAGRVVRHEA